MAYNNLKDILNVLDIELVNYAEELDCEHVELKRKYRNYDIRILVYKY